MHTKTYLIYTLTNPLTKQIFYVGCTGEPKIRFRQHTIRFSPSFNGIAPIIDIVDTVRAFGVSKGQTIERMWINKLKDAGHPLINQRMVNKKILEAEKAIA